MLLDRSLAPLFKDRGRFADHPFGSDVFHALMVPQGAGGRAMETTWAATHRHFEKAGTRTPGSEAKISDSGAEKGCHGNSERLGDVERCRINGDEDRTGSQRRRQVFQGGLPSQVQNGLVGGREDARLG